MAILYAHRGDSAEIAENTIEAFRGALAVGADALEMDVHLTRDGHVVVAHDPTGERTARQRAAIRDLTLAEVKSWDLGGGLRVPTLAEVVAAFPTARLNVELKPTDPAIVPAAIAAIGAASDRTLIVSFHVDSIRLVRKMGYAGRTGLARREVLELLATPRRLWRRRGDAAQLPRWLGHRYVVEKCHAVGLTVDFWTVDDPGEARRLVALGADGIMTNDPSKIGPALGKLPPAAATSRR
jgi:glycerophosphoryl diester phosphodiesterase